MRAPWQTRETPGAPMGGMGESKATGPVGLGWRRALVYGLGLSGRAAVELLRALGVEVLGVDGRPSSQVPTEDWAGDSGIRLLLGSEPSELPEATDWQGIDAIVVSPGVPEDRPLLVEARQRSLPILGEVELAYRCFEMAFPEQGRFVAITGSNGKSTTTALAAAMLEAAGHSVEACGNIGRPLAAVALSALRAHAGQSLHGAADEAPPRSSVGSGSLPIAVVELSSFQLQTTDRFHARAAALLNLSPDHLDRHGDFDAYRDAKLRIFEHHESSDRAVVNADDPVVAAAAGTLPSHCRWFSRAGKVEDGCYLEGDRVLEVGPDLAEPVVLFETSDLRLPGPHNLENAMAAALLARTHGIDADAIRRGLAAFRGLPHRLEKVRERAGVSWFDDSKGTNPAATVKSLEGFEDGRVLLVLGGIFKGGDLAELGEMVARKARRAYLIGEAADHLGRHLRKLPGMTTELEPVGTLDRAVQAAERDARPGEVVLLSPACSSFDQFTNFAERGRIFQDLVRALEEPKNGA